MSQYKGTTKRRYMWGIGVACSILLVAIACSWALEGRVGIRMRSFGSESTSELRREEAPVAFWVVVGGLLTVAIGSAAFTARGLTRVQREEADPAASANSGAAHRSGTS